MIKRLFDITLSSVGILLSFPLWLLFGLLIWLEDRGPVFYTQERVGKDGKFFKVLKIRSMVKDAEKESGPVQAQENDPRVTRVGRILRSMAMDELPQLINILKGDMSFVGPRALRPAEREVNFNPRGKPFHQLPGYRERHTVRPGLTGAAQVYLPSDTPLSQKLRYDILYIQGRSFWQDLKLIFLSFWISFRGKWGTKQNKI